MWCFVWSWAAFSGRIMERWCVFLLDLDFNLQLPWYKVRPFFHLSPALPVFQHFFRLQTKWLTNYINVTRSDSYWLNICSVLETFDILHYFCSSIQSFSKCICVFSKSELWVWTAHNKWAKCQKVRVLLSDTVHTESDKRIRHYISASLIDFLKVRSILNSVDLRWVYTADGQEFGLICGCVHWLVHMQISVGVWAC